LKEITRLLGSWPSAVASADGDEHLRGYLLAVDDYPAQDVEAAVTSLIKGVAPGVNPSFLPPPAVVGAECRRQMNLRLDSEHRARLARPKLPPPDIERSPESQARVRQLVAETVANMQARSLDEAPQERHRRVVARANQWWDAGDDGADAA
jgi:hypothetical protein